MERSESSSEVADDVLDVVLELLAGFVALGGKPGGGGVTGVAMTREVIGGFIRRMTTRAIGLAGVIESRREPCAGGVTGAALTGIVRRRRITAGGTS